MDDAEPSPQRRRDEAGAGRGADQGEARQVDLHRPRRRPLADHQVEREVLERRVEDLLDRRPQAVDLVDEQHLAGLEVGEDGGQVAGPLEHRAGGGADGGAHLVGDDVGQRRLAQARGPEQQHVVERLAALARRLQEDLELVDHPLLADELLQPPRPERLLDVQLLGVGGAGEQLAGDGHGGILTAKLGAGPC